MTEPRPPSDDGAADPTTGRAADPVPVTPSVPGAVPRRRPSVFEHPLFWLALVVGGVALAVSLSFLAEKTDLGGTAGDVGHYCQQVAVIKRTNFVALGASSLDGTDQAQRLVQELTVLEKVAPGNVSGDVREVRLSAEDALTAIRSANRSDPASEASLALTLQRAESRSEDAIDQMTEYTQEACGIDLTPTSTTTSSIPATVTTATTVTTAKPATSTTR
jgi:hypothetical protein